MIRENFLYCGIDLHKFEHTAVLVDCWNNKLQTITIENKPSEFSKLAKKVNKKAAELGLSPIYGLEGAYGFGRSLAIWLIDKGCVVKDVNPALAYEMRKSAPSFKKNDAYDAFCVATVMINHLNTLSDAKPHDLYWTLSQFVNRREILVKEGIRLKQGLHNQITVAYPSYHKFFYDIEGKIALYFWQKYPSPVHLQGKSAEELQSEFRAIVPGLSRKNKAELIFDCVLNDGNTIRDYQAERDFITRSLARCLENKKEEIAIIEAEIEKMLHKFDYKLTSIPGINIVTAAKLIAEIGDINRFKNADKLASFAGISPVNFSSAGKGKDVRSKQGNRTLRTVFYFWAVTMVQLSKAGKANNPVFREYFERKISEGKTKSQALVCIMRRLVNIVYSIMKNKTVYRPFVREEKITEE